MDLSSQRRMLDDAALVLSARERFVELVDALAFDLVDDQAAMDLRGWLDDVRPEALAALARLARRT